MTPIADMIFIYQLIKTMYEFFWWRLLQEIGNEVAVNYALDRWKSLHTIIFKILPSRIREPQLFLLSTTFIRE